MNGFSSAIQATSDGTVFLLAPRDKMIFALEKGESQPRLIAKDGQGPDEIDGGFFSASVIDDRLVVLGINTNQLKAVYPDPDIKLGTTYFTIRSFVRSSNDHVFAINVRPGETIYTFEGEISSPDVSLIRFRTGEDGWYPDGFFLEEEIMAHPVANTFFAMRNKLLEHPNPGHVYKIPGWGAPTFQVIDDQGNIVKEYAIPHPLSQRMPRDPGVRLELFRENRSRGRMLAGVTIDHQGTLYFLLDGLVRRTGGKTIDHSRRLIIAHHPEKNTYKAYRSEKPLWGLLENPTGNGFYSLDREDGSLLYLELPD